MFYSTSGSKCSAKSMVVLLLMASMASCMTSTLKVSVHGSHEPISDWFPSMFKSNIFNKHCVSSNNSDFSTFYGGQANASRLDVCHYILSGLTCTSSQDLCRIWASSQQKVYSLAHHHAYSYEMFNADSYKQSKAIGLRALSVKERLRWDHRRHWARELQWSSMQMPVRLNSALNTPLALAIVYALGLFGYGTLTSGTKRRSVLSTSTALILLFAGPACFVPVAEAAQVQMVDNMSKVDMIDPFAVQVASSSTSAVESDLAPHTDVNSTALVVGGLDAGHAVRRRLVQVSTIGDLRTQLTAETAVIELAAGTYLLGGTVLSINHDVQIKAATGATVVLDAGGSSRVLNIAGGTVDIVGLDIFGGSVSPSTQTEFSLNFLTQWEKFP
jgi:hypothetical protein